MKGFETAYFLDGRQMLLLLSLIDQRPVAGLPLLEEPRDWTEVSLSLLRDDRLRYENGCLVMEEGLGELLQTMKNAQYIYSIHGKYPEPANMTFYSGRHPTLLESLPSGQIRLSQTDTAILRRLLENMLMTPYPMPEAMLTLWPDDDNLKSCLTRWESQKISWTDVSSLWLQMKEVRGVLEYQSPEGQARWIWIEDIAAGLVLRQSQDNIQVEFDTASKRYALLRELRLEG